MIKLEETFTSGVGGFGADVLTYIQVIRSDKSAIYERSRDGLVKDFEVIKIKVTPKGFQIFNGKPAEDDTEMYASTGSWGKSGWSFKNKGAAVAKFNDLNKDQSVNEDETDVNEIEVDEIVPVKTGKRGRQPKERFELTIPVGKFTTKELSELNKVEYQDAVFFINEVLDKKIRFIGEERRNSRGKMSKIYSRI